MGGLRGIRDLGDPRKIWVDHQDFRLGLIDELANLGAHGLVGRGGASGKIGFTLKLRFLRN